MTTRSLVGAAARYTTRTSTAAQANTNQGWQAEAWDCYSTTPEVRFAANWIGNGMSLGRLVAARRLPDGTIAPASSTDRHRAIDLVASIAGGPDGQAGLLRDFGPHLMVAGEGWIVIRDISDGLDWRVLSVLEVKPRNGGTVEVEIDGTRQIIRTSDDNTTGGVVIRVWDPHPRRHLEADSPVRSALGLLEELRLLNASVKAITRSRLTGRGVLLVPQGARFPSKPGTQGDAEDDLLDVFLAVAEAAIRDPESAAATVPIVLELPSAAIGDVKHVDFGTGFDELAIRLREEAIRRFALGVEIPAEIILGQADANHWAVWSLQEEAVRLGIEPRLAMVCHALTTQWLRPLLDAERIPDAQEWMVWYDSSALRVRTNRAQTALEVYDRGELSGAALRRETGFDESDAPSVAHPGTNRTPADPPTRPELPVNETTSPPTQPTAPPNTDGLYAAADGLIWMALHRAGEKLRRTPACPRARRAEANQISASALHTLLPVDETRVDQWGLLADAFDRADEIATRYGADPQCLRASLDSYCRELLAAGVEHEFRHIPGALSACVKEAAHAV